MDDDDEPSSPLRTAAGQELNAHHNTLSTSSSPDRGPVKPYQGPLDRSPSRRPATPLRGIGKFLQNRRRGASPDSPSVRSDLLGGSVVAGLVATAIQEVESMAPDPTRNKPMADLVERAVKAEFKINQLEAQKRQIWELVSIAESQVSKEKKTQSNLSILLVTVILVDAFVLSIALAMSQKETQAWFTSLLVGHLTIVLAGLLYLKQLCFGKSEDQDEDAEAEEEEEAAVVDQNVTEKNAEATDVDDKKTSALTLRDYSKPESDRESIALSELKDTLAILPSDQKGSEWITNLDDATLLRFLRGHMLRVSKALKYIVKTAEWRVDYDVANLLDTWERTNTQSAKLLRGTWPVMDIGEDDKGNRVVLFRMSMCDFPGYFRTCAAEDVTRQSIYEIVKRLEMEENIAKQFVLIVDLGISVEDMNKPIGSVNQMRAWIAALMQYVSTLTKLCDPYFPETFHKILITRPPAPFWATWRAVQVLVPLRTRDKVTIISGEDMKAQIAKYLPKRCIPDFLDGEADTFNGPKGGLVAVYQQQ